MIEGFKKGFYTTSSNKERNPQATSQQFSHTQPSFFSIQQLGIQQQEWKKPQKRTHTETPTSEKQSRKQMKSTLHQEVSKLKSSGQMSMNQLIKVGLNLQEEVRKLREENEKLSQQIQIQHGLQDTLDFRMANQEREINALWKYHQDQYSHINSQVQRIQLIESILQSQRCQQIPLEQINSDKMEIENNPQNKRKQLNQNSRFRNYATAVKVNNTLRRILKNLEKSRINLGRNFIVITINKQKEKLDLLQQNGSVYILKKISEKVDLEDLI